MIISLAQINSVWENQNINMRRCEEFIKAAHEKNSSLILFPEMSLTGFTMDISALIFTEEYILKWLQAQACRYKINIGFGFAVRGEQKAENKFVIVSKDGEVLSSYTKIHPFSYSQEDKVYSKGKEITVCDIDGIEISTFICYDLRFPEVFQIASRKAQLITVAANWPRERMSHWHALLRARAIENQCFIAGVNRCGEGGGLYYDGGSVIVSPNGEFISKIEKDEKLITADLDFDIVKNIRNSFNIKNDRQEELYFSILKHKFNKI